LLLFFKKEESFLPAFRATKKPISGHLPVTSASHVNGERPATRLPQDSKKPLIAALQNKNAVLRRGANRE
jgi:hypothetical protein